MIECRNNHASVSMGNNLFVIGGNNNPKSEVFDSFSRKFTNVKCPITNKMYRFKFNAVCVGYKIVIFNESCTLSQTKIFIYDVASERWSDKKIYQVNKLSESSYIKYNSD